MKTTRHHSSARFAALCLFLVLIGWVSPTRAQDNPCSQFAFVAPCGAGLCIDESNDTMALNDALACAVEALADPAEPFNAINLGPGFFPLDPVVMDCPPAKWPCRFSGQSINNTQVTINEDSVSCDQQIIDGRIPAFLTATGSWIIGTMTISGTDSPCTEGLATEYAVLFTGEAAVEDTGGSACDNVGNDQVFSTVNRVDFDGGNGAFNLAVGAAPNSAFIPGACPTLLSGEFKCLQCDIRSVLGGIYVQVNAGTRVNIEKSDILATTAGIIVFESRASVNVFQTTIAGGSFEDNPYFGILATRQGAGAPDGLSVNLTETEFLINSMDGEPAAGAGVLDFTGEDSTMLLTVRGGEIFGNGSDTIGIFVQDVNDAVVSGARFLGSPFAGVIISADMRDPVSGSAIVGNNLGNFTPDLFFTGFTPGTSGNVVCPHPGFSGTLVSDLGDNLSCTDNGVNRLRQDPDLRFDAETAARRAAALRSFTSKLATAQRRVLEQFHPELQSR